MALISSQSLKKEEPKMADKKQKVAKDDIVKVNAYGQRVVVVPKGHPIPDEDPVPQVPIVQAEVEDKAQRSSRQKKR